MMMLLMWLLVFIGSTSTGVPTLLFYKADMTAKVSHGMEYVGSSFFAPLYKTLKLLSKFKLI
jgi:hypothetical protein